MKLNLSTQLVIFCWILAVVMCLRIAPDAFAEDITKSGDLFIQTNSRHQLRNILEADYAIHPILGTTAGADFTGDVTRIDLAKFAKPFRSDLRDYDANFSIHYRAEKDAAEAICRLALQDKLPQFKPSTINENSVTRVALIAGYNQIPILLTYRGAQCASALAGDEQRDECDDDHHYAFIHAVPLKHCIFGTNEFESLNGRILTDLELKGINGDSGAFSFQENHYIGRTHCFLRAEAEAAQQFRDRMVGLSKYAIGMLVGEPDVKTGPVVVWNDKSTEIKNWVYYLGHSQIPIRLLFKDNQCCGCAILSEQDESVFRSWNVWRFASGYYPGDTVNETHKIGSYDIKRGNPEGKTLAEILQLYGEPRSISKDPDGRPLYIYGTGPGWRVEIPFENGVAYGRISHGVRCGWQMRKAK